MDAGVVMAFTLNLTPEQEAKLRSVADQLKVSPEALVQTAVRDLLAQADARFLNVARGAALSRLRAGIDSMNFCSSGPLPSRDELHDRS